MNPSIPPIDLLAAVTVDAYARKAPARDDDAKDLFAQALGQHLAKQHDEAVAKAATHFRRDDRRPRDPLAAVGPDRSPSQQRGDSPSGSVVRSPNETSAKSTASRPVPPHTQQDARKRRTDEKDSPQPGDAEAAPTSACAHPVAAQPAPDGDAQEVSQNPITDDDTTDETAQVKTDLSASLDLPIAAIALTASSDASSAVPAVVPQLIETRTPSGSAASAGAAKLLLLTGISAVAGDIADPAGLNVDTTLSAALLAKLPGAQQVSPKLATEPIKPEADPLTLTDANDSVAEDASNGIGPDLDATRAPIVAPKPKVSGGTNATPMKAAEATAQPVAGSIPTAAELSVTATAALGSALEVPKGLVLTGDASSWGDAEFSAWSQQLGPGAAESLARNGMMRQGAFLAELKQNLQTLQPHEQVAIQIQRAAQNGTGRLTVNLQPAELGRVEIKLNVDKDKNVTASVVVDRPATLDMLQRDARTLERILQDAGLQTDSGSLSFSLRDSGRDGDAQTGGGAGNGGNLADGGQEAGPADGLTTRADVVVTADGYVDLET